MSIQTQVDIDPDCPNPHGPDAVIECWSPGGPCPTGRTVCESCGPCYQCTDRVEP